jgi:hypothetical protein
MVTGEKGVKPDLVVMGDGTLVRFRLKGEYFRVNPLKLAFFVHEVIVFSNDAWVVEGNGVVWPFGRGWREHTVECLYVYINP